MIAATFEERTSEFMEETIAELVALENDANDDDDSRLDHAVYYLRQFNDLFVYRGGHHVAIHFKKANGEINPVRVAIITAVTDITTGNVFSSRLTLQQQRDKLLLIVRGLMQKTPGAWQAAETIIAEIEAEIEAAK